eukprot:COSAG01_NODE_10521_length_2144_cov_4.710513_2_plen_42_part_00
MLRVELWGLLLRVELQGLLRVELWGLLLRVGPPKLCSSSPS